MTQHKTSLRQRLAYVLAGQPLPTVREADIMKAVKELYEDQRRSTLRETQSQSSQDSKIVEVPWDYQALIDWARGNEVLRIVHEAIIKECTRNRWDVKPHWMRKCPSCGNEFQAETERCPDCSHINGVKVATIKPDIAQRQRLKAFLEQPNQQDEMIDIVVSALRYMLAVDDWYVSKQKAPFTIYNEDSVFMRPQANSHGLLGDDREWFCPKDTDHPERVFPSKNSRCSEHPDVELVKTAYVFRDGTVKARFAKEEILHGKPNPWLPSLFGLSREISCLKIVMSIAAMDQNNFDIYNEGKLANIITFEGLSQEDVNTLVQTVEKGRNKATQDPHTGHWIVKRLRTLWLGNPKGPVKNEPVMPDSEKMQSLDWYNIWKTIVCAVYGVQDVFAGNSEPGTTGQNPRMKVDVNNNTTEFWQKAFSEPFNEQIVLEGLGVSDWVFAFNPVEEKDEMQDVTILQAKLTAIQTAISLGMKAELTDEQEVKLSGQPLTLMQKQEQALALMQKQQSMKPEQDGQPQVKEGQAFEGKQPFKKEEVFATEKADEWLVKKVKR